MKFPSMVLLGLLSLGWLVSASQVSATPFTLSFGGDESRYSDSGQSGQPSASVFSGRSTFSLTGDLLKITLENLTASPYAYTLSAFYFNLSASVASIALDAVLNGSGITVQENKNGGGMGTFDLLVDLGPQNSGIGAQHSLDLFFRVAGTGLSEADFLQLSTPGQGGHNIQFAMMKFTQGPNDDSAFIGSNPPSAEVPEPATMLLFGSGGILWIGSSWARKRRSSKF